MPLFHFAYLVLSLLVLPALGQTSIVVLGTAQDGGYPQPGCQKVCCIKSSDTDKRTFRTALALTDSVSGKWWLFEATPDMGDQLKLFAEITRHRYAFLPDGIFITHAHIGHYTGLMQLGREVMNTSQIPVYVLPRLADFLRNNGPWKQLVQLENIRLVPMSPDHPTDLGSGIRITAIPVPHRDEFSETAGFRMEHRERRVLFIPDIDKWSRWNKNIVDEVQRVDEAYLDATFMRADELPNRNMSEIPHPLVGETMALFDQLPATVRSKISFIHMNHTNPLLWDPSALSIIGKKGYRVASQGNH